jgi:hypothetical protein
VRAFGRVLDESGEIILAYASENGVSRTIDVASGRVFNEDAVPAGMNVIGDPMERVQHFRQAVASGQTVVAGLTESELLLESVYDEAYYERVLIAGRDFTEEQKEARRKSFFQRDMSPQGFAVPYYGDLNAVALVIQSYIDVQGLESRRVQTIRTEEGQSVIVQSSVTHHEVVDAIPQEVIALMR